MKPAPYPVPSGRTARRLTWPHLPPALRADIEHRLGSPVVSAESRDSGYTPGLASVLTCADGSRHFVKAASASAQRMFAHAYRTEARNLRALPTGAPAAPVRWTIDGEWVVLGMEYVDGVQPSRPWREDDLAACLGACERAAALLTPVPEAMALDSFADEFGSWPAYWDTVASRGPHHQEAAALAARFAEFTDGDTVVHSDLRDDNVLLGSSGAVFCDWNWPVRGASWLDSFLLLIGPRGDGLDVAPILAERPLLRHVPDDAFDAVLALVTGYFLKASGEPVPAASPYIREHQRWQADVCWDWLCERRGWTP